MPDNRPIGVFDSGIGGMTVVKSIVVPNTKSNSRAKTLVVWTFLGGVLAVGAVIGLDFVKKKINWPEWWALEEEPSPELESQEA